VLTRSIDFEPLDLQFGQNFLRHTKHAFIAVAVTAAAIAALDLVSAGGVKSAVAHVRNGGDIRQVEFNFAKVDFAEWPDRLRAGISQISVLPEGPSVTLAIPRDAAPKFASKPVNKAVVEAPKPAPKRTASATASPVAGLAAVRKSDAVEFAMSESSAMSAPLTVSFTAPVAAVPAPVAARTPAPVLATPSSAYALAPTNTPAVDEYPAPARIELASLNAGALTGDNTSPAILPAPTPIPLAMVPMPIPAPGVPPPSPAQRLKLDDAGYAKAEKCLANAIYWESRSEPLTGQEAVAQVVMNRVFSGFYPNDVCSVVYQNAHRHLACQFTFACDGKRKVINERGAWARANRIAKQTLDGSIYVPAVAKSTHYHATYVHPYWTREMRKMVRYGIHNFYRPYAWGSGSEEPVWGKAALADIKKR
jgi:Cell Wall Hydrolase